MSKHPRFEFSGEVDIMGSVTQEIEIFRTEREAKIPTNIQAITNSFKSPRKSNTISYRASKLN